MIRISIIAVFFSTCLCASLYAQNKSAGDMIAGISPSSSSKGKLRRSQIKEVQPVNSITVLPMSDLVTFPALSFKSAAPKTSVEEKIEIRGAKIGDKVELYVPRNAALPGLTWVAWVNLDNEVKIRFTNLNETPQTIPALEVFKVRVIRK